MNIRNFTLLLSFFLLIVLWSCAKNISEDIEVPTRSDDIILESRMLELPTDLESVAGLREHCKMMPEMDGCEQYE